MNVQMNLIWEIIFMNALRSKVLLHLKKKVESGNIEAINTFWDEILRQGTPIIEKDESDNNNSLVTILFRGQHDTENIVIHGTGVGFNYMENRMERLLDTDVWYKTYIFPNDIEFVYWLSVNDALDDDAEKRQKNFIIDPLNPEKFIMKDDPEAPSGYDFTISYVKMPKVKHKRWIEYKETSQKGMLDKYLYNSVVLGNERRIWVYTPHGYSVNNEEYSLVLLNDGNSYVNWLSAQNVLDNLLEQGIISPVVVVFISSSETRMKELTFNDDYLSFVINEIIPFVKSKYNIANTPEKTIVGGFSLGGLAAAYLGLKRPDIFGNVLSQSGSLFWKQEEESEWLIHQYENIDKLPLRFFITYGSLENSPIAGPTLIQSNKKFIQVLEDKGYEVSHLEFKSGHDYLNWGETLAEGLISLFERGKNYETNKLVRRKLYY